MRIRILAVTLPLATCSVLALVRDEVASATAVLVLVLWVVAAAASGDRVAGLLAAISSGVWFDFFLTRPFNTFTIADPDDIEATILLLVIGVTVTEIALWGQRQHAHAARRSAHLDGVLDAARIVSEGEVPAPALVDLVSGQITSVLGVDECRYVDGAMYDARIAVLDHDGELTLGGRIVDVDRVGLPTNELVGLPVRRESRVVGHFLVTSATRTSYPSLEARRVAVLLADQVAAAVQPT